MHTSKNLVQAILILCAMAVVPASYAHHNTQSEFGSFASQTVELQGEIKRIFWGNPHIYFDIEVTSGDIPSGEKWRVVSHPTHIQEEYGYDRSEFTVGDQLTLVAWTHLRGAPMVWPRAIQVNDGPLKSNLRYTDMIDIANGTFADTNIIVPANLNGSAPGRAGPEVAEVLAEKGYLDEAGLMIWPLPE